MPSGSAPAIWPRASQTSRIVSISRPFIRTWVFADNCANRRDCALWDAAISFAMICSCALLDCVSRVDGQGHAGHVATRPATEIDHRLGDVVDLQLCYRQQARQRLTEFRMT